MRNKPGMTGLLMSIIDARSHHHKATTRQGKDTGENRVMLIMATTPTQAPRPMTDLLRCMEANIRPSTAKVRSFSMQTPKSESAISVTGPRPDV
jgi:hypothetical protein